MSEVIWSMLYLDLKYCTDDSMVLENTQYERSGEMLNDFLSGLIFFWSTYVTSYEGIATMLVIAIMLLKFLINQKASSLKFKKMLVSVPGELQLSSNLLD